METVGILDFLKHYDELEQDYVFSLFAVKAPFAEVTREFFSFHDNKTWKKNVPTHLMTEQDMVRDYSYALIEVRDSEWSIVVESVFYADGNIKEAQAISERLQTLSFSIYENDHGIEYQLFSNGERIEYMGYGGTFHFESQIRENPDLELDNDEDPCIELHNFVNETLCQKGIYIPACYPIIDPIIGDEVYLAVSESSRNRIGQADIIYIDEPVEDVTRRLI
jgi:hypothetical protein